MHRRMKAGLALAAIVLVSWLGSDRVRGQQDQHAGHGMTKLGTVKFANSCAPAVQPDFARGMALLHSFEFGPAIEAFATVVKADPSCGIALWATALAQWGNPFSPALKPPAQLQSARRRSSGPSRPARKPSASAISSRPWRRSTIASIGLPSASGRSRTATRWRSSPRGTRTIPKRPPSMRCARRGGRSRGQDLREPAEGRSDAREVVARAARSSGLAHYIIHSYDVPALAPRGVAAARRYAKIAPAATHALHMPSHTFTRLGYWQDSIDTNILSAEAAQEVE